MNPHSPHLTIGWELRSMNCSVAPPQSLHRGKLFVAEESSAISNVKGEMLLLPNRIAAIIKSPWLFHNHDASAGAAARE